MVSLLANAQFNFFVEGTGNFSLISKSKVVNTYAIPHNHLNFKSYRETTYKADYVNKLGADITLGLNYFFQDNFSFDTGINFKNVNFNQKTSNSSKEFYLPIENGSYPTLPHLPTSELKDDYSLFLLSVPVSVSYYLLENTLSASLGATPGYLVYSKGGSGESADFNKFQMGIELQLRYQIAPKIWLTGVFQEYSTKLYKPELKQSFSNLRMLKLGLKYDF
jgi:hypothetical protein